MDNHENYMIDEEEYIDVKAVVTEYFRYFLKRWYLLFAFCVLGAGLVAGYKLKTETHSYSASYTYTVEKSNSVTLNSQVAARLANGVATIASTNDFSQEINQAMGKKVSGYTFTATSTENSNMMTVTSSASSRGLANQLLEAFHKVYPKWVSKMAGSCTLTKVDESLCTSSTPRTWSLKKMLILGWFGGAFLWFFMATISIMLKSRVYGPEDMDKIAHLQCLGVLLEIKKKKREESLRDPLLMNRELVDKGYSQSIRSIRHRMDHMLEDGKKVFLLTSTLPEEGKSLLTLNLAYAMKKHGKKVLVIDADFYSQGIAEFLQINTRKKDKNNTLYDYLIDYNRTITEPKVYDGLPVILSHKNENTMDQESKTINTNYSDLMNSKQIEKIINTLKEKVDVILIDTSAVSQSGDAAIFSDAVDAVFYIVRCDYADIRDIRNGIDPFYRNENLAGYILNRAKDSVAGFNYGRYYQYGRSYGYGYGARYGSYFHEDAYSDKYYKGYTDSKEDKGEEENTLKW